MTIFWRVLIITGLFIQSSAVAQHPVVEVPNEIEFAGMTLKLTSAARKIIQKDVNNLMKYPKGLQVLVDRANLYFPLMDKVMEEEKFPNDIKFLALQESGLIADAVSSSNAVGYWQFKKESAIEVGLRVDNKIDERMHIVASTVGAIKYFRRNNQTFDNWIYTVLSYNLGLTGAKNKVDTKYYGARTMTIDSDTHWYVLRFLAHKLAYQNLIGNSGTVNSMLFEYIDTANKSLSDIVTQQQLELDKNKKYNLWLKTEKIPDDKIYSAILEIPISRKQQFLEASNEPKVAGKTKKESYPTLSDAPLKNNMAITVVVNKTRVILSRRGDTPAKLAYKGEITREEFLKYNEMKSFEELRSNTFYYLEEKRNKAAVLFHVVQYGETIWDIAHNYGIKMKAIRDKNRIDENEAIVPGRVLYLRTKRPKNKPIEIRQVERPKPIVIQVRDTLTAEEILKEYDTKDTASTVVPSVEQHELTWHTVVSGETLFAITKLYKVPTDSIVEWNNMPDYKLSVGQKLIVGKKSVEPQQITHTVVAGETIYKIAILYKVSTKEIQEWNNKTDLNLKIGEKIIIKKKI